MFKDHFSAHSHGYAKYRPTYPPALFEYLAQISPARKLAWDVATGSGQAALGLALHFDKVHASDASRKQIESAATHERITYRVEPAESSSLAPHSVDLVTIAQALHWLELDRFYAEVKRVARPSGVIAAWTYSTCSISPDVDNIVAWFYHDVVGRYWPEERQFVEREYKTLPFPFKQLRAPAFEMDAVWDLRDFIGYLGTWSATQRYVESERRDYRGAVADKLAAAWGAPDEVRRIRWPLHLLIGSCSRE